MQVRRCSTGFAERKSKCGGTRDERVRRINEKARGEAGQTVRMGDLRETAATTASEWPRALAATTLRLRIYSCLDKIFRGGAERLRFSLDYAPGT